MNWTVIWLPDAEQELAAIWLAAPGRDAVTHAANVIDHVLKHDPENAGESRPNHRRVLLVPPLGVVYRVQPDDRRVDVLHVWHY